MKYSPSRQMWVQGCVCALFLLEINCFPIKHTQSGVNLLLVLSPSTTCDVYYKTFLNRGGCVSSPAAFKSFSLREVTFYSSWQGSGWKVYEAGSDIAKTLWIHLVSCDGVLFFPSLSLWLIYNLSSSNAPRWFTEGDELHVSWNQKPV